MARPKFIIDKITTRKNLLHAWFDISASKNPNSHGFSEQTIQQFKSNQKQQLELIRNQLKGNVYRFGKYRLVKIPKKGGKKRSLKVADVRDRVVQRAITRVLEKPLIKQYGLYNKASFAYLKNRGIQSAIKQMLSYHQKGNIYIFETDIVDFFGSINVDYLLNDLVFPKLQDNSANHLIEDIFKIEIGKNNSYPEEDWELYGDSTSGLPQGGNLSPLFSNVYLNLLDQSLLDKKIKLIRYADDFIVMAKTIDEAEGAYELSMDIIENQLGLQLHDRNDDSKTAKTRIVQVSQNSIKFLGIRFNGNRIWPSGEKTNNLFEKIRKVANKGDVIKLNTALRNLLQGWIAAYGYSDINITLRKKIDNNINRSLWGALKKFGWVLSPKNLNVKQRHYSGVKHIDYYLENIRENLADKPLFEKYWTD